MPTVDPARAITVAAGAPGAASADVVVEEDTCEDNGEVAATGKFDTAAEFCRFDSNGDTTEPVGVAVGGGEARGVKWEI
jgi:hypothetical protein